MGNRVLRNVPIALAGEHAGVGGALASPAGGRWEGAGYSLMNVIRLRYRIDNPRLLRNHIHMVDGAGYFFFPDSRAAADPGLVAHLELDFAESDDTAFVRGLVWARSEAGLWIEIPDAEEMIERIERQPTRGNRRLGTELLLLVETAKHGKVLCRARDVSLGGARLAVRRDDVGEPGDRVAVTLPDEGDAGVASARLVWTAGGFAGLEWIRSDLVSRSTVVRLVEQADSEWETARTATHPARCRCGAGQGLPAPILLLG